MPPPLDHPALHLSVLEESFVVHKLLHESEITAKLAALLCRKDGFVSVTKTDEEISIVLDASSASDAQIEAESGWKAIKIRGPLDFGLTGILNEFTSPLKQVNIPVFAISTWNTDYILVPNTKIVGAVEALMKAGWRFEGKGERASNV